MRVRGTIAALTLGCANRVKPTAMVMVLFKPRNEREVLRREWDQSEHAFFDVYQSATTADERRKVKFAKSPKPESFAQRVPDAYLPDESVDRLVQFLATNVLVLDHALRIEDVSRRPADDVPATDDFALTTLVPPGAVRTTDSKGPRRMNRW